MHLSARHGRSIDKISERIDAVVPWGRQRDATSVATATGKAIAKLAEVFERLKTEIVLIVGDRPEALAAAVAGHLSGLIVAHIHGGDRALGQVDDSLRHAITKLAHVHLAATAASARRLKKLGEQAWRIHTVGSPGIDGIRKVAASSKLPRRKYALLLLHPTDAVVERERGRAELVMRAVGRIGFPHVVIVFPNNDPGADGIIEAWENKSPLESETVLRDISRPMFLGLLRDAAVLVGNSSSGIIEAASFGTPVVDIGTRQMGRERSGNVRNVGFSETEIAAALNRIWHRGRAKRWSGRNVYGIQGAGERIARVLHLLKLDGAVRRKLIAY